MTWRSERQIEASSQGQSLARGRVYRRRLAGSWGGWCYAGFFLRKNRKEIYTGLDDVENDWPESA